MKKWIAGIAGLIIAVTLAGCSSSTVANMKGAKITKDEYYNEMKKSTNGQATLRSMIVLKALEQQYGKKVSDKQVTNQYNKVKNQYGSSFSSALQQNGMTTSSFKDQIHTSLLSEVALKDQKKVTNKELKKQWAKYEPKITVQHILVKDQKTANTVLSALKKDHSEKNFTALAKKNSTDTATASNGGKLPAFDNTDTSLGSSFKKAAFGLKQGDYTTSAIKTSNGYEIIRSIKNPGKGTMASHKKELTKQIYTSWQSDTTVMTGVIKNVLKKANVSIKDDDLKDVLSVYLSSSNASASN